MSGVYINEVYCCPHGKHDNCDCKKPKTGLVKQANFHKKLGKNTYIIGDMGMSDMKLGQVIGAKKVLVLTGAGEGSLNEYRHTWENVNPDYIAKDMLDAASWICSQEK